MTLRRTPEDFIVMERLGEAYRSALRPEWSPESRHGVYELTKTSRTTPEAAQELASALKVKPGAVSYAGLKDKHARTTQYFSVLMERGSGEAVGEAVHGRQWDATRVGWAAEALEAPGIDGNRFEIVVRGLARETCQEMERRARLLELVETPAAGEVDRGPTLLFVNYFGAQRFGSARHGEGFLARHLIKGEFEQALRLAIATPARKDMGKTRTFTRMAASRWGDFKGLANDLPRCPERAPIEVLAAGGDFRDAFASLPYFLQSMYVEAFQSHLWNRAAHALAIQIAGGAGACLRSDDQYGEMLFPPTEAVIKGGRTWLGLDMPVLGPTTPLATPWGEAMAQVLADEGIEQASLRIPGLRRPFFGEASRQLFARADEASMSRPVKDELDGSGKRMRRTLSFVLPRGSYATVVLRGVGQ